MGTYAYKALAAPRGGSTATATGVKRGGVVAGSQEAPNEAAVRASLREQGLIPVEVRAVGASDAFRDAMARLLPSVFGKGNASSRAVKVGDRRWFFQTLRRLLESKAPVEQAVATMQELAPNPRVAAACAQVRESLRNGEQASDAVAHVKGLARKEHLALLEVGHESGRLAHTVALIDRSIEARRRLRKALTQQLTYPAIVVVAAIVVLWILAGYVIPQFASTLESVGAELPWQTSLTMLVAQQLAWLLPVVVFVGIVGAAFAKASPAMQERLSRWAMRVPLVKSLVWNGQGAVAADIMATMLEGGGDILTGLEQAERALASPAIAQRFASVRKDVREGVDLGGSLAAHEALPPMTLAVVRTGAAGGGLADAMRTASEQCAEMQEDLTQQLLAFLQPAVILVLVTVVGWVIYSLVIGMLTINEMGSL